MALEDAGIRAFFPLPDLEWRTPFSGMSRVTYDTLRDEYRCPRGQPLPRRKTQYTTQAVLYRANAAIGNMCPVTAEGTVSDHGRVVHRSFSEAYLNTVRGSHTTAPCQRAMRKRKVCRAASPTLLGNGTENGTRPG